jgi:CubicO group peptidase (beta-lactamase class C family)
MDPDARAFIDSIMGPETELGKALSMSGALSNDIFNTRDFHAAEVPAAGGIGEARAIAKLYAACVGPVDGIRVLTPEQVKLATVQQTEGPNRVIMGLDLQFGLGFFVPSSIVNVGGPNSFGHFGAGGSVGWADPDAEFAFGYVMNKMGLGLAGDTRVQDLVGACYAAAQ